MKKLQWNFNKNQTILIKENAIENVVCKVVVILSQPQCFYIKGGPL